MATCDYIIHSPLRISLSPSNKQCQREGACKYTISPICQPVCTDHISSDKFQHSLLAKLDIESELLSDWKVSNHDTDATQLSTNFQQSEEEAGSYAHHLVPPPCSSMEAYLLLEVAWSNHQYHSCGKISPMRSSITTPSLYNLTVSCLRGQREICTQQMSSLVTFAWPSDRLIIQLHLSMQCKNLGPAILKVVSFFSSLSHWITMTAHRSASLILHFWCCLRLEFMYSSSARAIYCLLSLSPYSNNDNDHYPNTNWQPPPLQSYPHHNNDNDHSHHNTDCWHQHDNG